MKKELNISDDSNDSDNLKTEDLEGPNEGIKDEIKEESYDDSDTSSDDGTDWSTLLFRSMYLLLHLVDVQDKTVRTILTLAYKGITKGLHRYSTDLFVIV